jgi:uncharacterized membrane protein
MKLRLARGMFISLMTLCLASSVGATPAEDVERGAGIQISQFGFTLNGTYEVGGFFLPKGPSTLDTVIDARSLGLGVSLLIPLRGARSGDTITWSFDLSPSPAVDIGWPNTIVRIRGSLVARAALLPGDADPRCASLPCPYTVRLTGLPESEATVTVSTVFVRNDHRVENIRFAGLGGLPRPRLQQFVLNLPRGRFCSRNVETYLTGRVVNDFRAPTGGAWVVISSSDTARVRAAGVTVREGEQSAPFGIYIAPNWSGGVVLTASAGGMIQPVALTVEPPSACVPDLSFTTLSLSASCPYCFRPLWLNGPGDVFGELEGKTVFLRREWKEPRPLGEVFMLGQEQMSPLRLNNQGQLIGSLLRKGQSAGFFADMGVEAKPINELMTFEDAEVVAANDLGIVVGTRSLSTRPTAFYFNGVKQFDVPVKAEWSSAVAVNNREEVVGNLGDGKQSHAFVFYHKAVELVGDLGEGNSTATALSEAGHVVGFALVKGKMRGFVAERTPKGEWQTKDLGALPGFDDIRPAAVNASGLVVGTARSRQGGEVFATAFLYSPQTGLVDLNKVSKSEARIIEVLTINDANEILVVGDLNDKKVNFILRPAAQ